MLRSRATANTQIRHNLQDESTGPRQRLLPLRGDRASPARPDIRDERPESGDRTAGATQGTAAGRAPNNVPQRSETPHQERRPPEAERTLPQRGGRNTRASVKLATLNISGRGSFSQDHANNKWQALNQIVRNSKIGIMALQETHLDEALVERIHSIYGRRMRVYASAAPRSINAQGVAFLLNREIVDVSEVKVTCLVPGRAIYMETKWHAEKYIHILNVYAPNARSENARFWTSVNEAMRQRRLRKPDVLLGDFNVTEDALDRLPARLDDESAVMALRELTESLGVVDGWRVTEPDTKGYSFPQRGSVNRSRLDRIYTTQRLLQTSSEWEITTTSIPTDHKLVSVKLSDLQAPYIGKGRWTLPVHLIGDPVFMKKVDEMGQAAVKEAKETGQCGERSDQSNPQRAYVRFKGSICQYAKQRLKEKIPKIDITLRNLNASLISIEGNPQYLHDQDLQTEAAHIQTQIGEILRKRHSSERNFITARYLANAERPTAYWSQINKDPKPRDLFYSLRKPNTQPAEYVRRSDLMAELARDYHDELQNLDVGGENDEGRREAIDEALRVTEKRLSEDDARYLANNPSESDVEQAIRAAQTRKASGLDGIPYELWKALLAVHKKMKNSDKAYFNCLELLTIVFNDIEEHGFMEGSTFAEGWMCPIYKKKDRREIGNYRPITLLNTDYKIYTKILAIRLSRVVPSIVHINQAGFIPKRHIENQTQTCRIMVDYCEATEENGAIVALDQEKAYDRVAHDYLWQVLEHFAFPESFISRVKQIYRVATTQVAINGELSSSYEVTRGVRQGDPLSCLLFIVAIEPLANMLRESSLNGFRIPGVADRLVASLFADDTSSFLSQGDGWSDLWRILHQWCKASRAKFNDGKTEVLPVGTEEYRRSVLQTRSLDPHNVNDAIPPDVRIASDGEPVRVLGAWIGNRVDQASVWTPVLDKIASFLDRWNRCHPSLIGKRHIIQMGPGGISQYLTKVQGMPRSVEKSIAKMIRTFLWDSPKTPPVSQAITSQPVERGGLDILDIQVRNEAIELMWLSAYLRLDEERPLWAYAADVLISLAVSRSAGAIRRNAQINTFLQTWSPTLGPRSKLPVYMQRMFTVAKKHRVSFAAVKLSAPLKKELPIWYHLGALPELRKLNNTPVSDCLRNVHGVMKVHDLVLMSNTHPDNPPATPGPCECAVCTAARREGCRDPTRCRTAARRLLCLIKPKWDPTESPSPDGLTMSAGARERNLERAAAGEMVDFDPSVTDRTTLSDVFRAFANPHTHDFPPALRPRRGLTIEEEAATVYIDWPRQTKGEERETLPDFVGLFFGTNDERNRRIKTLREENAYIEHYLLLAALVATRLATRDAPLTIICASSLLSDAFAKDIPEWEDRGWIRVQHAPVLRTLVSELRQRCARTQTRKATGQADARQLAMASALCLQSEASISPHQELTLARNPAFDVTGARLSRMTQKLAYQGILDSSPLAQRQSTERTLGAARHHLENVKQVFLPETFWRSLRHKDYRRQIASFMWKVAHNALRCGDFWLHIPGKEGRAVCAICDTKDDITHILTGCSTVETTVIWRCAQLLWEACDQTWVPPTVSELLCAGQRKWKEVPRSRRPDKGASRLWRIMLSESAFLIWKLRCERVIQHSEERGWVHTKTEVIRRWRAAIQSRLQMDRTLTSPRFGRSAIPGKLVERTWAKIVQKQQRLPDNWATSLRVLVGILPMSEDDFG